MALAKSVTNMFGPLLNTMAKAYQANVGSRLVKLGAPRARALRALRAGGCAPASSG